MLFISDSSLWGQSVPASTPASPIASRLDLIHRAAEQTDPMPELEQLCDVIGPCLTGSVAALHAEQQVLAHMREIGLQGLHGEVWTLPRGWQRGPAAASLATPFRMPIPIAAYGWTGSTPKHSGPVPVVLIDANDVPEHLDALVRSQGESWSWQSAAHLLEPRQAVACLCAAQLLPLLHAATAAHAQSPCSSRYSARQRHRALRTTRGGRG